MSAYPVQDYRFVLLLRGESLSDAITGTDPQVEGAAPLESRPLGEGARKTAEAVNRFVASVRAVLAGQKRANMVVLRGFSGVPILPDFGAGYKLNPAAIAAYPMYRGLAHLVGMKIIPAGGDFDAELDALEAVSMSTTSSSCTTSPQTPPAKTATSTPRCAGWKSWTPGFPAC